MIVVGVDEAGRGPLAGPVVAAAVAVCKEDIYTLKSLGVADSKALSPRKREEIFALITQRGFIYKVQAASPLRIDKENILQATLWAMKRAVCSLPVTPDLVIVDGNFAIPDLPYLQRAIPKADRNISIVGAASIIAKVIRDRVMIAYDKLYPGYGFASNKGYPTKEHKRALTLKGISPIHRKTFKARMDTEVGKQ
ncbi:ribonuclease HII [Acetomicrobium sp.]|jgi:ribonuclease HII|uniref:ribonuclease HII n=2 Tax=Acetomicrobium TaxID=49894 RepID=UPI0028712C44|nr:ribonuclease HII [Acetomicrobium sp.]MDR9770165.1 ribonuclease HII [Acetomicrobium sp.]HOB10870.1 ribonuclease HII [Acetomicrobium sp.]